MTIELPQRRVAALQALGARLIESRKPRTPLDALARDLLLGAYDVLAYAGLDSVLEAIAAANAPLEVTDRTALADHAPLIAAVVAQLEKIDLDGGGPRNLKPKQLADCVIAGLGLTVVEATEATTELGDDVRRAVAAALAGVVDGELVPAKMREVIVADARARCGEPFLGAFGKVAAQLDERGLQLLKTPKIPLDALQAAQHALYEARTAFFDRVTSAAIDRAQAVLAKTDADLAARVDQPVTLKATPREVAARAVRDPRVAKNASHVVHSLLESLTDLLRIAWRAPEQTVLPYAASKTFAVGDVIEHPKFGRGTVVTAAQRIEVEFGDNKVTLVHAPPRR